MRASELAEAVVLADLTLVLSIASQVLPLGGALLVIAVVPMAAIAARNRLRAVIAGTVAASAVGFLVLGSPVVSSVCACAAVGAVVGIGARRGWGAGRTVGAAAFILWPIVAVGADAVLLVLSAYRKLVLAQVRNSWRGVSRVLRNAHLVPLARVGDHLVTDLLRYWWLTIPIGLLLGIVAVTWLARRITSPTIRRLRAALAVSAEQQLGSRARDDGGRAPDPVPVELRSVTFRYPGATSDALHDVSFELAPGELVAVVGPNGSGKSTLARVLCGVPVTSGEVKRPGAVGLGQVGGTAIVFQRPELQVLGVRVRDDVVWGLPSGHHVDVEALLERVGLRDFADRETSGLSGGELQRLAVAAALARRPRLLVSDEATAMVDAAGRSALIDLLRSLAADDGIAVVHVTHLASEAAAADRTVALERGRVVPVPRAVPARTEPVGAPARPRERGAPLIILRGVGHVYSRGTPWAHRALRDVDLHVDAGEALLVVGHNGSGKSTLAWILAGLLDPSEGDARIEGRALRTVTGQVGVAFQHARLQLLRPTVLAEVAAASGAASGDVWRALGDVGLDPAVIGPRRVDELSGGQARRVVLAGVLAARPRAIVLDEPFAGLDDQARSELTAALTRMRAERGTTLVCVSHDHDLPRALVDREVELVDGQIAHDGLVRSGSDSRPGPGR